MVEKEGELKNYDGGERREKDDRGDGGEWKTTKSGLCGRKARATTEIVLVMIERRRQHNRDSVLEEKGRQ